MIGPARALMFLLLPLGAAADGRQGPTAQGPNAPAAPLKGTTVDLGKADARLTVPVAVGGSGPFDFIIDTGAERTVVSRQLAGSLRLAPGLPVTLVSMGGSNLVGTVIVPGLSIQSVGEPHTIEAPALEQGNLGAAGLLGIDTLSRNQVSIDFESGTMTVRPADRRNRERPHFDEQEIVVFGKSLFGQLIVTDAWYGNTRIRVVIDTGAEVSMGNSALRRQVHIRDADLRPVELTSVTGERIHADYMLVSEVRIGKVRIRQMPIAFADVAPFKHFGLADRPALLLGMDALSCFRHVEIDFPNRQVRFLMPRPELTRLNDF